MVEVRGRDLIKIKKFRNGKIKEISKSLVYEYGEYDYEIVSGKQQLFDKKGRLFYEVFYDNFGNLIYQKQFNNLSQLYRIIETTKIDLANMTVFIKIFLFHFIVPVSLVIKEKK